MATLGWTDDQQSAIGIPACKRVCSESLEASKYMLSPDGNEVLDRPMQAAPVVPSTQTDKTEALTALNYPLSDTWDIDNINPDLVNYIIEGAIDCNDLSDTDWCGCDDGSEQVNYLVQADGTHIYAQKKPAPVVAPAVLPPAPVVAPIVLLPAPVVAPIVPPPAAEPTKGMHPVAAEVVTPDALNGFALYINCYATPGLCQQGIDQMIAQAIREVEENNGGTPWNLGAYGASTERGQIAARVRFAVSELCSAHSRELLHMFVTTDMGALSNDILAALRPFARYVVVGR